MQWNQELLSQFKQIQSKMITEYVFIVNVMDYLLYTIYIIDIPEFIKKQPKNIFINKRDSSLEKQ